MTRGMATVMNDFKTVTYIRASSIKARLQVKAYLLGRTERYMTENGSVGSKKGTASGVALKGTRIQVSGKGVRLMDMESMHGETVIVMRENGEHA